MTEPQPPNQPPRESWTGFIPLTFAEQERHVALTQSLKTLRPPTRDLETTEGKRELENDISKLHDKLLETLQAWGVKVVEIDCREGIAVQRSQITEKLQYGVDPRVDWITALKDLWGIPPEEINRWLSGVCATTGLIVSNEQVEPLTTVSTFYPACVSFELGVTPYTLSEGSAQAPDLVLRKLAKISQRPGDYRILNCSFRVDSPETISIVPAVDSLRAQILICEKV